MCHVLIGAVGALFRRHAEEETLVAVDDLHSPDYEGVVEGHVSEGLQLILVPQCQSNLRDLQISSPRCILLMRFPAKCQPVAGGRINLTRILTPHIK